MARRQFVLQILILFVIGTFSLPIFGQKEAGASPKPSLQFLIPKAGELHPNWEKKVVGDFTIWFPPKSQEVDKDVFVCGIGSGYALSFEVRPQRFGPTTKISFTEADLANIRKDQAKLGITVAWMKQIAANAFEFETAKPSNNGKTFYSLTRVYIFEGQTVVLRVIEPKLNADGDLARELLGSFARTFEISPALAERTMRAAKLAESAGPRTNRLVP